MIRFTHIDDDLGAIAWSPCDDCGATVVWILPCHDGRFVATSEFEMGMSQYGFEYHHFRLMSALAIPGPYVHNTLLKNITVTQDLFNLGRNYRRYRGKQ